MDKLKMFLEAMLQEFMETRDEPITFEEVATMILCIADMFDLELDGVTVLSMEDAFGVVDSADKKVNEIYMKGVKKKYD
jgi:hypothetical protein